jgi:hypothetical protein
MTRTALAQIYAAAYSTLRDLSADPESWPTVPPATVCVFRALIAEDAFGETAAATAADLDPHLGPEAQKLGAHLAHLAALLGCYAPAIVLHRRRARGPRPAHYWLDVAPSLRSPRRMQPVIHPAPYAAA